MRILGDPKNEEDIPQFDQIFQDSDDESDDDTEDVDADTPSNMDRFERRMRKNRERRDWEKNRDKILFNHSQYSFYARSTALVSSSLLGRCQKTQWICCGGRLSASLSSC